MKKFIANYNDWTNKLEGDIKINILATVVDGVKTKMYLKNFGEFFINQVDAADTVIINKIDKLNNEKLLEVVGLIKEKNPYTEDYNNEQNQDC